MKVTIWVDIMSITLQAILTKIIVIIKADHSIIEITRFSVKWKKNEVFLTLRNIPKLSSKNGIINESRSYLTN